MKFYTELVIVTVVALVAANAWIDFLQELIRRWYPHNLIILFVVAASITGAAILLLHILFGNKKKLSSPHVVLPRSKKYEK